jgi:hypothetical protein
MVTQNNPPNLAQDFIRIHRVITRGLRIAVDRGTEFLNEGFSHLGLQQGFVTYIQTLTVVLEAHHLGEDEIAFPSFGQVLPAASYERLAADHQKISALIGSIRHSSELIGSEGCESELNLLVEDLRKINAVWIPHIVIEEVSFSQKALTAVMSPDAQSQLSAALTKHAQEHALPPYLALPFVLYNLDAEDRASFAATLPTLVWEELIPKVWIDQWAPMKPFLLE